MNPSLKHMGSHTISNTLNEAESRWHTTEGPHSPWRRRKSFASPITPKTVSLGTSVPTKDLLTSSSPPSFQRCKFLSPIHWRVKPPSRQQTELSSAGGETPTNKSMRKWSRRPREQKSLPGQSGSSWTERKAPQRPEDVLPRAWLCAPVLGPQSALHAVGSRVSPCSLQVRWERRGAFSERPVRTLKFP